MKGIIIVNSYAHIKGIEYQSERLKEELVSLGAEIEILPSSRLSYGVSEGNIRFENKSDFVVYLDKDNYLANIIDKSGVRMFNSAKSIELCDDKMLTHIALSNAGINMPDTIPCMLCYTKESEVNEAFLKRVEKRLGYPVIAKQSFGSLGNGVYLIKNFAELKDTEKRLMYYPHIYQKYISSNSGTDIRVIVIGGKYVAAMKRQNKNDYRSNIELGGKGEKFTPNEEFICVAERAADILGLDYCGVDLLIDGNNRPVLCEVNSNAFFTGIERCTGINIAKEYAGHIIKNLG